MNTNIFFALVKATVEALLTGYMGALVDILKVNAEMLPNLHYKGVTEALLTFRCLYMITGA